MGLGGAPPLLPLQPADLGTDEAVPPVVAVLAAGPTGLVSGSLEEALLDTAGPGRILNGTLAESGSQSTIKLVTQQGVEITLARPPGLSIPLGSTISLRITTVGLAPQALVLTVNGRPFSYALTKSTDTASAAEAPTAALQAAALQSARQYTVSPSDQTAALATSALVDLSRALLSAPPPQLGTGSLNVASAALQNPLGLAQTLVAILVRTVGLSRGIALPAIGTRYRVSILNAEPPPEAESAAIEEPPDVPPATPANTRATTAAAGDIAAIETLEPEAAASDIAISAAENEQDTPTEDIPAFTSADANFVAQNAGISGRVVDVRLTGSGDPQTLVETALGTLSLPVSDKSLQPGSVLQLKITHVAAPSIDATGLISAKSQTARLPTLVEELSEAISAEPALRQSAVVDLQNQLSLNPGPQLAAAILEFLQRSGKNDQKRGVTDATIKAALKALGTSGLSESLSTAASAIGRTIPAQRPTDWSIAILPFIGAASVRPARFYFKDVQDAEGKPQTNAHRFVLDVELKRLGPLQFDGLLQDRRFDLMLRARLPLERELRSLIQRVFHDAIGIGGFTGDIGFGGLLSLLLPRDPESSESHRVDA